VRVFRVRWQRAGGHIHTRVFTAAEPHHTFALLGEIVFNEPEWNHFRALDGRQLVAEDGYDSSLWEFIEDRPGRQ
jgi:hypothetical protein